MEVTEVADDLYAQGWAAPAALGPDPRDFERSIAEGIALRNVIHARDETIADQRRQLAATRGERDEALGTAVREKAAHIRLDAENRALRGQVDALTRAGRARPVSRRRFGSWSR